ncbi:hypothetical protein CSB11_00435 [Candidatus Campbellbacteria bacterium]|nr:MAG: hypothetical protein CSB11_00435 [Candidatus Campbellbacteria bacterium]
MKKILVLILILVPFFAGAQERYFEDSQSKIQKVEVLEIIKEEKSSENQKDVQQFLKVQKENGEIIQNVLNDLVKVSPGTSVYINEVVDEESAVKTYYVEEVFRLNKIIWLFVFFMAFYLLIAGKKGLRSLVALAISVFAVWLILIPALAKGYDALTVGVLVSSLILFFAIFITHKISVVSFASFLGSLISVLISTFLAYFSIYFLNISVFGLEFSSQMLELYPEMNLQNLLIATIIIGIVGILDDVAVMQAILVREFMLEDKNKSVKEVFKKAMKVGQEHTAALVNTIVLAYTAVALPMFLIIFSPNYKEQIQAGLEIDGGMIYSNEFFIVEIARSVVGSFGLILTVPLVTIISILIYKKYPPKKEGGAKHSCAHTH